MLRPINARLLLRLLLALPVTVFRLGEDNPAGITGDFNGEITSVGSYDPYTGNAKRIVNDLVVAGAVGTTGLGWARVLNTRYSPISFDFGRGGWGHSWKWTLAAGAQSITYPDGEAFAITANSTIPGTGDKVVPSGSDYYLVRANGSKVFFKNLGVGPGPYQAQQMIDQNLDVEPGPYQAQQMIDPYGRVTTLSYDQLGQLAQITEPAGRWLKITRNASYRITRVDGSDG